MGYMSNGKLPIIGKTKVTQIDKGTGQRAMFGYEWGLYFWRLPDGHLFKDDDNNLLSIESVKGDLDKMAKLRKAAAHYGQPEGSPWFYAGAKKATDEEYAEQVDRMKNGLLPSMNDLGAVAAAKKSLQLYGGEANE
jgi:hypothetical protein